VAEATSKPTRWSSHPYWPTKFISLFIYFLVWALGVAGPTPRAWLWPPLLANEFFFFSLSGFSHPRQAGLGWLKPPTCQWWWSGHPWFFKNIFHFFIILVFIYFLNIN
jgi:hypothetical protein